MSWATNTRTWNAQSIGQELYPEEKANENIQCHRIPSGLQHLQLQIGLVLLLGQKWLEVLQLQVPESADALKKGGKLGLDMIVLRRLRRAKHKNL